MGWYSRVASILKYDWRKIKLWTNIKDSAPYLTIRYANNPNDIKLFYTN